MNSRLNLGSWLLEVARSLPLKTYRVPTIQFNWSVLMLILAVVLRR